MSAAQEMSGSKPDCRLRLLGGFELSVDNTPVQIPHQSERLCALLALNSRPVTRSRVASQLWSDSCEERAAAKLRTALWSLRKVQAGIVKAERNRLCIPDRVHVDLREVRSEANRTVRSAASEAHQGVRRNLRDLISPLLPSWDEEWLDLERARIHQLTLHALEAECKHLLETDRLAEAIDVALVAISGDPLRESAQALLIQAHLAEGNIAAARRQFDAYRELLRDELGLKPTSALFELIGVIEVHRHGG